MIKAGGERDAKDKADRNLLHFVVESQAIIKVKFLLENGTDINIKDEDGRTFLHYAVENNCKKIAQILQKKGLQSTIDLKENKNLSINDYLKSYLPENFLGNISAAKNENTPKISNVNFISSYHVINNNKINSLRICH